MTHQLGRYSFLIEQVFEKNGVDDLIELFRNSKDKSIQLQLNEAIYFLMEAKTQNESGVLFEFKEIKRL